MFLTNVLFLLSATAGAAFCIAIDALRLRRKPFLPLLPEELCTPETIVGICKNFPVSELPLDGQLSDVELIENPEISSNCNILIVKLHWENPKPDLPDSLFIKIPSPVFTTRLFLNIIESWQLETSFFRNIAPDLPIMTPRTYAAVARGSRFCLIQENLRCDPAVELFTNFDMSAGPDLNRVRQCLDTFARLHSVHYNWTDSQRHALLPLDHHLGLGKRMRHVAPAINSLSLTPCRRRSPGVISDELAEVYRLTMSHWPALIEHWFAERRSLCHGDSHLGNFYLHGNEMGMLDFQAVHWGNGIRDVQYFLIDSLPVPVLAQHERELVSYYVDRRALHGSAVEFDTTWEQYRSFSFHTWMTMVASVGLAAMNAEQDELMQEILRRTVAAIKRLDYPGWLTDFLIIRGPAG